MAGINWPLVQYKSSCCAERKRRAWLAVGAGPGMAGPMLRPPPCLWQTRQWIISPSGTRPGAVGSEGRGAVMQPSREELAYVWRVLQAHLDTLCCCAQLHFLSPPLLFALLSERQITLTASKILILSFLLDKCSCQSRILKRKRY